MAKSAARLELERAYRILGDVENLGDTERHLRAALVVIQAWEAVSHGLVDVIEKVLDEEGLTEKA